MAMAEPDDMILPMLREMRADIAAFHEETVERLDRLEPGQREIFSVWFGDEARERELVRRR